MSTSARIAGLIVVIAVLSALACTTGTREEARPPTQGSIDPALLRMFGVFPAVMESPGNLLTEEKVSLGRMLYYDGRLSSTGEISCNSCHDLENYGVDGEKVSDGVHNKTGDRNSPTV